MCFSRIFYKKTVHDFDGDKISFEKSSLPSMILKKKQDLLKHMQYFQALQIPSLNEKNIYLCFFKTNFADFYNEILFFYNYKISSCCTDKKCKMMSVGPKKIFIWTSDKDQEEPQNDETSLISTEYYFKQSFKWIFSIINDQDFLFKDAEYQNDISKLKLITKRIFRFYAHVYYYHLYEIKSIGEDFTYFYISMRFFISFTLKYDFLDSFEFEPLRMAVYPFSEYDESPFAIDSDSEESVSEN